MNSIMNFIKKKILKPDIHHVLFGTTLIIVLMLYVFVFGNPPRCIAYVCYVISAYLLFIDIIWYIRFYKENLKPGIMKFANKNKYISRYFSDLAFKTIVSIHISLSLNMMYVVMNFLTGIYYHSLWSFTLAVYYFFLTAMRFMLLRNTKTEQLGTDPDSEYRKYRTCAYILLMMNFALIGIVTLAIHYNNGFSYAGYLIYIMAMYAFYNIIYAIVSIIKYRKAGSPVISASKVISFSAALISILSLEMAMLNSFDTTGNLKFRNRMIGTTGFAICAIFIATSCYMIIHANRQLKKERQD